MTKKLTSLLLFCCLYGVAGAHHIIGGEMYYTAVGPDGPNNYKYLITLKVYRGCEPVDNQHASFDATVYLTVYDNTAQMQYGQTIPVGINNQQTINLDHFDPCIVNPPPACYEIAYYYTTVSLPVNAGGYTISYQRCCRTNLTLNINDQFDNIGATYFTVIPGTQTGVIGDNSPVFNKEEAVLICNKFPFTYNYSATDPDGDSLSYAFGPAYDGGSTGNVSPNPSSPPPFPVLSYINPYSAVSPMGTSITIDPHTGIISGRPGAAGIYIVTVEVFSYRKINGQWMQIATHQKDFQIQVQNCTREAVADIPPKFAQCNSFTINFTNLSTPNKVNLWDFGDGDTSTQYSPTHTYRDTGLYTVKLVVDPGSSCGDSGTTTVAVFPYLVPKFTYTGNCIQKPTRFADLSKGSGDTSGTISYRRWNFGDPANSGDTSNLPNPSWQYSKPGTYMPTLFVATTKGCETSVTDTLTTYNTPPISVTPDTILCYKDSLQLNAQSIAGGNYHWSPDYNITDTAIANPLVFPRKDTTWYYVRFTDNDGCVNTDSVQVRVKDSLKVNAGADTTICSGDTVLLHASSDDNYLFSWYDNVNRNMGTGRDITVSPIRNNDYTVIATLGDCKATSARAVNTVPYPPAEAGSDVSICYNDSIRLQASGGAFYAWQPPKGLSSTTIPDPEAHPLQSTRYIVTVTDTLGCPRPVNDSILVTVIPPVPAFAGHDTIITTGHSFQLHASGGTQYTWTPPTGLSDPNIPDPFVSGNQDEEYHLKVVTPEGCVGYDSVKVRYIAGPDIYVPNAFTPNGDGINDIFRPIPVGIVNILFFRVFNRWGQEVFETRDYMKGWNGLYKGQRADAGTYVWEVEGKDFNGQDIIKKGTVILIR